MESTQDTGSRLKSNGPQRRERHFNPATKECRTPKSSPSELQPQFLFIGLSGAVGAPPRTRPQASDERSPGDRLTWAPILQQQPHLLGELSPLVLCRRVWIRMLVLVGRRRQDLTGIWHRSTIDPFRPCR